MRNEIKIIREKLALSEKILTKVFLDKLLNKFTINYKIKDLTSLNLISPLKRGKYYINNLNRGLENPYEIAKLYFEGNKYMFGGIGIYNMYGFSTQLAEWYTVYNTQVSGDRIIGKTKFIFRKQRDIFFYGNVINKNGINRYNVMNIERAFIQMLKEGAIINSIPSNVNSEKLLKMAKKYSSKTIISKIEKLCI